MVIWDFTNKEEESEMIRDYKEEYNTHRRNALSIVKTADNPEAHVLYMSFTKYGKSILKKENKKFLDDAKLDCEFGILSDKEYEEIKTAYSIIEKSIHNGKVY